MVRLPSSRLASLLVLAACGNRAEPSAPATASSAAPPPATGEPAVSAAPSAPAEAEPRKKRPLEIKNSCGEIVTVVFGEDPKSPEAGRRQIAGDSSVDGPRDAEGKMTVWLLDAKGEPIVKVHVTRGMKRVEIGRSCRTLDAR
jgi:hypothetical protein